MKTYFTLFVALLSSIVIAMPLQAQQSEFDELPLNGIASYEQLRKQYYIGALYLESISQSSESVLSMPGKKRMELRITIDRWSPRRFSQQWNQSILINSDQAALEEFSKQIQAFTNIPKDDLKTNDRIVIDMDPDTGTTVYLNNQKMFSTPNNAFFDMLLSTWIGRRPPSSTFKNNILTLPTDQTGTNLLTSFEGIKPSEAREKEVAKWLESEKEKKTASADKRSSRSVAAIAPPGTTTKVTAKRPKVSTTAKPTIKTTLPAAIAAAPKPAISINKPTLGSSTKATAAPAKPKPTPKPVAKAKPAPKPKAQAPKKEELAKQVTERDQRQQSLKKNYRSNILKLTYLNTQYPRRSMDLKQEGLVILKITLDRRGNLLDVEPETSSKYNLLNKAAHNAVKKSAPYPEAPRDLDGSKIVLMLPFNFKL